MAVVSLFKTVKVYTIYYKDTLIAASDNKKLMKKFMRTRNFFNNSNNIEISHSYMSEKMMHTIEKYVIHDTPYGVLTDFEMNVFKFSYICMRDELDRLLGDINDLVCLNGKHYISSLITFRNELENALSDTENLMLFDEMVAEHDLITAYDINEYLKAVKIYSDEMLTYSEYKDIIGGKNELSYY